MTLGEWLSTNKVSNQQFADDLGVSRMSVWRYRTGAILPDKDTLNLIYRKTGGKVTANDFVHAGQPSKCKAVG